MTATLQQTLAHLRAREAARTRRALVRADAIRARLPEAATLLRDCYGVAEVILFGSLARGEPREDSDVDLAVRGLDPGRYFEALAELDRCLACDVDLVDLDRAPASLVARVAAEGVPW